MTEQNAPLTLRLRPAHGDSSVTRDTDARGDTAGDARGDTASGRVSPGAVPVSGAELVPLSPAERIRLWADAAARIAGEVWAPCGRVLHSLWHPDPETMTQHRAYIRSREWVPPGLTGWPAAVVAWAGIAYHILIAQPLKFALKTIVKAALNADKAADRPLRFIKVAVFTSALILLILPYL